MTDYDSTADTLQHILRLQELLHHAMRELLARADWHDRSKLRAPEKPVFDRLTPLLKTLTFGSPEYQAALDEMGPALQEHYRLNPGHHPQAHANGINDMNLFDLLEMFMDWKAASERMKAGTGSISDSITVNAPRFGMSEQLEQIFRNTARYCGWARPAHVYLDFHLDHGPLSDEQRAKLAAFADAEGLELKSNFEPISQAEADDPELLKQNMVISGSHHFQYYLGTQTEDGLRVEVHRLAGIRDKLSALAITEDPDQQIVIERRDTGLCQSQSFRHAWVSPWHHAGVDKRIQPAPAGC